MNKMKNNSLINNNRLQLSEADPTEPEPPETETMKENEQLVFRQQLHRTIRGLCNPEWISVILKHTIVKTLFLGGIMLLK